jgi:Fe-S-cluster containining protein
MTYDCQRCGACCVNPPENVDEGSTDYVEVETRDAIMRRPELVRRFLIVNAAGEAHLRLDGHGRCQALRGRRGCKVSCAIYHVRPRACRRVQEGSELCKRYRRDHGLPV